MPEPDSEYLTTTEVARLYHVDASAVRRWVISGKLRPSITTPGGHHRFIRADVERQLRPSSEASA